MSLPWHGVHVLQVAAQTAKLESERDTLSTQLKVRLSACPHSCPCSQLKSGASHLRLHSQAMAAWSLSLPAWLLHQLTLSVPLLQADQDALEAAEVAQTTVRARAESLRQQVRLCGFGVKLKSVKPSSMCACQPLLSLLSAGKSQQQGCLYSICT
jgi:hypothetical protein